MIKVDKSSVELKGNMPELYTELTCLFISLLNSEPCGPEHSIIMMCESLKLAAKHRYNMSCIDASDLKKVLDIIEEEQE